MADITIIVSYDSESDSSTHSTPATGLSMELKAQKKRKNAKFAYFQ